MTIKEKLHLMDEMAAKNEERRQAYLRELAQEENDKED